MPAVWQNSFFHRFNNFYFPRQHLFFSSKHKIGLNVVEMDRSGTISRTSAPFAKTDFCAQNGLQVRDLRLLESPSMRRSSASSLSPCILSRGNQSILASLVFVRAIIRSDCVKFFETTASILPMLASREADEHFFPDLLADLQEQAKSFSTHPRWHSFEFMVLECILDHITQILTQKIVQLQGLIDSLLTTIERNPNRHALQNLLLHNKELTKFMSATDGIRSAIEDLLRSDSDMEAMYLSRRIVQDDAALNVFPAQVSHDELELLLEHFLRCMDEIVARTEDLAANIKSTEDISNIALDTQRNALLRFEIRLQIAAVSMGLGTLIAGVFGMNITNFIEHRPWAFCCVTGGLTLLSSGLLAVAWSKMASIIRESQ